MVSMRKISVIALATTGALALTACAHGGGSAQAYQTPGFHPFGGGRPKPGPVAPIGVNGYLWRASLDTLAFMPLASADPYRRRDNSHPGVEPRKERESPHTTLGA